MNHKSPGAEEQRGESLVRLRRQAEATLRNRAFRPKILRRDLEHTIRELELHQIELELQNESLVNAQQALEASRQRYFELYDEAPVGYLTLDPRGGIHEANRAAGGLLQVDYTELVGKPLASFLEESAADALHRHLWSIFSPPETDADEVADRRTCDVVLRRSNPAVTLHLESVAIDMPSARTRLCRSALFDVSRRVSAEASHQDSDVPLREVLERMGDVLLILDRAERRISYVSPALAHLAQRSLGDLLRTGGSWVDWFHPDDRHRLSAARASTPQALDEVCRLTRPNGDERWLRVRSFPAAPASTPAHDCFVLQDVTSEREMRQQLQHALKMEAVGAMASGIAHDFGNLLQSILGCLDVAISPDTSPERRLEYLEQATAAVRRGGELTRHLLSFARKAEFQRRPIEVDPLMSALVKLAQRLTTEQVSVQLEVGAPDVMIVADPSEIEQVLMNLVANGRDAMPDGGSLTIRTAIVTPVRSDPRHAGLDPSKHYVCITIGDSGIGMDAFTRERIFDPFFTTKGAGKGTGLGLPSVLAVVTQLGGKVDVESEPKRGTTFSLYLPICGPAKEAPQEGASELPRFSATTLLIEDDEIIRLTVRLYLTQLGFGVLEAHDAHAAEQVFAARGDDIDLLVSDVVLPGPSGPELARRFADVHPRLRVLLISASPEITRRTAGGWALLRKPFTKRELAHELLQLLPECVQGFEAEPRLTPLPPPLDSSWRIRCAQRVPRTILLVDDERIARDALRDLLGDEDFRVLAAADAYDALDLAANEPTIDILVSDLNLPGMNGAALARTLREARPGLPVIFISGESESPLPDAALVQKPIAVDDLVTTIDRLLNDTCDVVSGGTGGQRR